MPITSGYGQGTSFTNVQGPSGMDVSPYLMALLQAEQRHLSDRAQSRGPSAGAFNRTTRTPKMASGREGDQRGALQDKLLRAQASKATAEAAAMRTTIPTRLHPGGAGFTSAFSTPDHLAMTGAQRSVFLPDNAHQIGGIGEMSPEDVDFLLRMRAGRGAR